MDNNSDRNKGILTAIIQAVKGAKKLSQEVKDTNKTTTKKGRHRKDK